MRECMGIIYPRTAAERAMMLQEAVLRATAGKIKWCQAAESMEPASGRCDAGRSGWRGKARRGCWNGEVHRAIVASRKSRPKRSLPVPRQVLRSERAAFHEKLREDHQIGLSYTWVRHALQQAGLVKPKAKRGVPRKRRERRPLPGMMLHIDGSDHQWFQHERGHDLIVILDDATSESYYAQLAPEETTFTVMAGLCAVIDRKGLFCSLYSDRGAHFWLTPKSGGEVDYERPTQVGRASTRSPAGT